MALPSSRNTTYANGVDIVAADMNDLQDCFIDGKHGEKVLTLGAADAYPDVSSPPTFASMVWQFGVADVLWIPVTLHQGDRIVQAETFLNENSIASGFSTGIYALDGTTGPAASTLDTDSTAGGGTFVQSMLDAGSLPYTIPVDVSVYIKVTSLAASGPMYFYHTEITYDHP